MDSLSFCYWLMGYFELSQANSLTETQVQIIRDHLQLVFNKVTPDRKRDNLDKKSILSEINSVTVCIPSPMDGIMTYKNDSYLGPPDEDGYQQVYFNSVPVSC